MISPISVATVGVTDLEVSVHFYRSLLEWEVVATGEVGGPDLEALWRMSPGLSGRATVVGAPGLELGRVRLVEWDRPGELVRDPARNQDFGHYALNFRVEDLQDVWEGLEDIGGSARSRPNTWVVAEGILAHDSLCYDPDGITCDVFELPDEGPLGPLGDRASSELQTMAIRPRDIAASAAFYTGLGYETWYDQKTDGIEGFLHLAEGTTLHNVNFHMPSQSRNGRVELAAYLGFPGVPTSHRAVPPNIGIMSITFQSDDFDRDTELVEDLGATSVARSDRTEVPPFGPTRVATFLGPDGEAIEIVEAT